MDNLSQYTQQNRRAWDEIAHIRAQKFPPAQFFAEGGTTLDDHIIAAAGEVRGQTLLHLQCATGEDTLSWSVLGAEATGVDISPKQIDLARQKATDAGLSTRFIAADVYDTAAFQTESGFDIVFTGGGALTWLPDIEQWGQVVAANLKPGGRLILEEEHPVAMCMSGKDGQIIIEDDYFGRRPVQYPPGWRHFAGGENAQEPVYEAVWPLGDIVTALAQAGLIIESLQEFPSRAKWRFGDQLELAQRLPGGFLLLARK